MTPSLFTGLSDLTDLNILIGFYKINFYKINLSKFMSLRLAPTKSVGMSSSLEIWIFKHEFDELGGGFAVLL